MQLDWNIIAMAIPLLGEGALVTLRISVIAIFLGTIGGTVLGLLALSTWRPARMLVAGYVDFVRGTPLLIQIFLVFFALPVLGLKFSETWSGIIALSLNCSAYVSEIVRGTVGSIEKGQSEAASSIGMTHSKVLVYILLPQALRPIIPPLTNELISLIKNSSLLSVISVYELTRSGQALITAYFVPFEIFTMIALYYYVIVTSLSFLSRYVERRLPSW